MFGVEKKYKVKIIPFQWTFIFLHLKIENLID